MRKGLSAILASEIQYKDIHERIDPQAVLNHYGAENDFEQTNTDGTTEVIHSCLIDRVDPHHQNGDQNPSASCNLNKKLYVCYSYVDPDTKKSGYDMLHFIMKMEGKKDPGDVLELVNSFLDDATETPDSFATKLKDLFAPQTPARTTLPVMSERILRPWARTHPYVVERGIDLDTASRLQIGYDPVDNRITIPHFFGGRLVGWQKRAIPDRPGEWPGTTPALPKYRSSPGFPKSETLYRYDEAKDAPCGRAVVVESPFSVIKAEAAGFDVPVVATFGAKITDTQIGLLTGFRNGIVVWMDPDDAGNNAERRLVTELSHKINVTVVIPDRDKDMGDYDTADEMRAKIDNAIPAWVRIAVYEEERREWARSKSASER